MLVIHDLPLVAAGLTATLRAQSSLLVRRHSASDDAQLSLSGVNVVVGDLRRLEDIRVRIRETGSSGAPVPAPKFVVVTTDSTASPVAPDVDAWLPAGCAEDELFATVHGLVMQGAAAPRGGLAPGALRRVREHVDARLAEPIAIEQLARIAGLSSCHFARAFKQSVGVPPHRYVMERRLETATQLIRCTHKKLADIALDVGFCDQSHLTRLLAARKGVTPMQLRRASS